MKLGINPVEEAHHLKKHGSREVLLPATILEDDLPVGFEKALGVKVVGQYIFKPSEWNELWEWMRAKLARSQGDTTVREGRDGYWLLLVGEARWLDPDLRKVAGANAELNAELWSATGMRPQQET